jgi:transcription elongation GreA/GreB family factor
VQRFRIVGQDETDPALGWIGVDSPLARGTEETSRR